MSKALIDLCAQTLRRMQLFDSESKLSCFGVNLLDHLVPERSTCVLCGAVDNSSGSHKIKWCGGCFSVRYCSKTCQRSHRRVHKPVCNTDAALYSWKEMQYATVRMFVIAFKMLLLNVEPKRHPLTYFRTDKIKGTQTEKSAYLRFRAWAQRCVGENIGSASAQEAYNEVQRKFPNGIVTYCVDRNCKDPKCLSKRKEFMNSGDRIRLDKMYADEVAKLRAEREERETKQKNGR